MPGWSLVDSHPTQGRTFQRPLDAFERTFLWFGLLNGTSDSLQHYELHLSNGARDADSNIERAWLSTKRRFPLAGATVRGPSGPLRLGEATRPTAKDHDSNGAGFAPEPHFVVREHDLAVLRPHEVLFEWVNDREEAQRRTVEIVDGPRPLSEELLVQLYVFRETERADVLHLATFAAHCVTDVVANYTLARCLLDTLARGGSSESEPAQVPLEDRLAMVIPSMDREPVHLRSLSPARRRWRRAAGAVIFQLRIDKRQGGHTLPCRITRSTPHISARSGHISMSLTPVQSAAVLASCRLYNITFGHAYLALAQVAMARVLYRRYLRGEISEEEWEYRKIQPHLSGGPLNLRPYLDKAWFDGGGGGEFMLSVSLLSHQLPFMTLGTTVQRRLDQEGTLLDGAPPFSDLLSIGRFLHRARLIKKQATAFFRHPLFFEIILATSQSRIESGRLCALQWLRRVEPGNDRVMHGNEDEDEVLSVIDIPTIVAHGGSSLGDVDPIFPSEYPLPPTHPLSPCSPILHPMKAGYTVPPSSSLSREADTTPKITVEESEIRLHTRPSQLYLGAASSHGQLKLVVVYDGNVFGDEVVREWLGEVKRAVLWYLGQTHHRSGQAQQSCGTGDGQAGLGEGTRSKL